MSAKKGTLLPISGTLVPNSQHIDDNEAAYTRMVAAALHKHFEHTYGAIKIVMGWTGASERTVKNWFAGAKGPNGTHLIVLAKRSDIVFQNLLQMADRQPPVPSGELIKAREGVQGIADFLDQLVVSGIGSGHIKKRPDANAVD